MHKFLSFYYRAQPIPRLLRLKEQVSSTCQVWKLLILLSASTASWAQGRGDTGVHPLPPTLAALLPPPGLRSDVADITRLRAARAQWANDSLACLLVYSRLGQDFLRLQQPDSLYRCLHQAWRRASSAQQQRQPAEVVLLAKNLAEYHYTCGAIDSARLYYRQAIALFQMARLDSLADPASLRLLPTTHKWAPGRTLAGILTSTGLTSRTLGNLPEALAYYERAAALYQQQHAPDGLTWTQSLLGEAYAEQDNYPQALAAYEQARRTAHTYLRQQPQQGSEALAGLVLEYYGPLLLASASPQPLLGQLVAEATQALQTAYSLQQLRAYAPNALLLARLNLLPAQAALIAGRRSAAVPWLAAARRWLHYGTQVDTTTTWHDPQYAAVRSRLVGLQAWYYHDHDPVLTRRLLDETIRLTAQSGVDAQYQDRLQLAHCCLAMREPARAIQLLRPLLRRYQRAGPLPLSELTGILAQAYAQAGRYDSAYLYSQRTQRLTNTVRQARQFAALAATEARFRTREQASRITLLTQLGRQQTRYTRLALGGAVLLGLLALGIGLSWRTTQRLNKQLGSQATQLRAQAMRLSEIDAAKNQFFANVSHELRTPLTLMLGPLSGLLDPAGPLLSAAVQGPVILAYRHARRLLELVNRILDLTKLEAGWLATQPIPIEFTAWLRRVVSQFDLLAVERGITLVAPADLPMAWQLLLDADKAEQILSNLLANALTHTPAGGTVWVQATLPGPNQVVEVTVRDTGPGIAPAEQARVFERFYQSPQRQAQGGTGLGLALSHELTQLLGGTLTLYSEVGKGATFTMRLPAPTLPAEGAAPTLTVAKKLGLGKRLLSDLEPPAPAGPPHAAAGTRPRVLVVEDQPDLREYLRTLLDPTCEVLLAADGQSALALLAREAPVDLLTTDVMMPRLSGMELLTQLRANPAYAQIPVLMLTARADEMHRLAALTVGVDDYVTKPFVPTELLARVDTLLARQQVRRHFATLPAEQVPLPPVIATLPTNAHTGLITAFPVDPPAPVFPSVAATEQLAQWQQTIAADLVNPTFGPVELAAVLCLSERTLYRRLGELAGLTPAAWIRELRLTHARQLLEAGSFSSVAEVATNAGFTNIKSFSQRYAERFGRRPSEYRRLEK